MFSLLVAGVMGLSVAMFVMGMGMGKQPDQVAERLDRYGTREAPKTLQEMEMQAPFSERVLKPLMQQMTKLITRFTPQRTIENTRRSLELAGNPNGWTAADFLGVRGLAALVCGGLPFMFLLMSNMPPMKLMGYTVGLTVLGFVLPGSWLGSKIKARQKDVLKSLPDALDLMTISIEAGMGFDQAMSKVSEKWDTELSRSFKRAVSEMRMGKSRRESLRDMAARIDLEEMTSFCAAIIQADQLGVSMSKVMRIQSEQMRIKRRQRAEEAAAKAPIKMLIPLAFLIFPALFIVLLGPAVPKLMGGLV
jgi:tight adherence protein C